MGVNAVLFTIAAGCWPSSSSLGRRRERDGVAALSAALT
jgi:hypothetical protein